jgi:serine/threonine protein kinase
MTDNMTTPCPDDEKLAAYLDRALPDRELELVARHLDGCTSCRGLVACLVRGSGQRSSAPFVLADGREVDRLHPTDVPRGARIAGRYVTDLLVGIGGMGAVYRAHDDVSRRTVAVKVVRGGSPVAAGRFAREVQALSGLNHPGIVRYLDHGMLGDDCGYLVMEWLEGEDLAARLKRGCLTWSECRCLVRQLAEALGQAHRRGLLHRDIKPRNIFLVERRVESAKLLDFSLARWSGGGLRVTATGQVVGTVGYMAPEQLLGDPLDARTDVFGLGCVLYACLCGRSPFDGPGPAPQAALLRHEVPPVSGSCSDLPAAVDRLVAKMLAWDPAQRHLDAAAVLEELEGIA